MLQNNSPDIDTSTFMPRETSFSFKATCDSRVSRISIILGTVGLVSEYSLASNRRKSGSQSYSGATCRASRTSIDMGGLPNIAIAGLDIWPEKLPPTGATSLCLADPF